MNSLEVREVHDDGLVYNQKTKTYARPRTWNSFIDVPDPGIIIVDSEKNVVQINYPGSSLRQRCDGAYSYILKDIKTYLERNKEMLKFRKSDLELDSSYGEISDTADVYINPRLVMNIKPTRVKVRTTFASESVIKIRSYTVYEDILSSLKDIFKEV